MELNLAQIAERMDRVIDHLDAVAKLYPIKALAPELKSGLTRNKAESTLRCELTQQPGYKLGLITAVMIMAKTRHLGGLAALDMIEAVFNRTAFELPEVTPSDPKPIMKMVSRLSREFSETVQEVATALDDGRFTPEEAGQVIRELDDLIRAAIEFKAVLRGLAGGRARMEAA